MLCKFMSEENNWQLYRDELDGCLASATPCIPYLGQYLTQVCHQLSYNKMRAEKDEVKLRRRSQSFVGMADSERKKDVMLLRRRSSSFHRGSLEFCGETCTKRTSATSISTPVSPLVSEDENESPEHEEGNGVRVILQTGRTNTDEDAQSLEFSLSLDDRALDMSALQPESSDTTTYLPTVESDEQGRSGVRKRLPSQKSIVNFHSTPVKDANGYIRPLCAPFARELNFDNSPVGQPFDEPDFGQHFGRDHDDVVNKDNGKSSDEDGALFRLKIPSISLQRTSSHSSTEEWVVEGDTGATAEIRQQIRKSRSLESSLSSSLRNGNEGEGAKNSLGRELTPSHSIPSLDSDSVFSVGEGEGEDGGGGGGEAGRKGEDKRGGREVDERENEDTEKAGFVSSVLECSLESEFTNEDVNSSFTTPESSLQGFRYKTMDSSITSAGAVRTEKNKRKKGERTLDDHAKTRRPSIQRSKSTSGLTNYRHKWRWKKAVALASNKHPPSTLNNADPFDLLQTYQKRSHDCRSTNPSFKIDFRTFLNMFTNNTETRNYELSFEREP